MKISLRKQKAAPKMLILDFNPLKTDPELQDRFSVSVQNRFSALRCAKPDAGATESYSILVEPIQSSSREMLMPVTKRKSHALANDGRVCNARTELLKAKEAFLLDSSNENCAVVSDR